MSRTLRKKRKSDKIIRDGDIQYVSSGCKHHNSCNYCRRNRTFSSKKRSPIIG